MRCVAPIVGGVMCVLSLSYGLAGVPTTRPAPATAPTPDSVQKTMREVAAELERSKLALEKLDELRRQSPGTPASVLSPLPDHIPPGSDPRSFNGFTYYIVPLGSGTGL